MFFMVSASTCTKCSSVETMKWDKHKKRRFTGKDTPITIAQIWGFVANSLMQTVPHTDCADSRRATDNG